MPAGASQSCGRRQTGVIVRIRSGKTECLLHLFHEGAGAEGITLCIKHSKQIGI